MLYRVTLLVLVGTAAAFAPVLGPSTSRLAALRVSTAIRATNDDSSNAAWSQNKRRDVLQTLSGAAVAVSAPALTTPRPASAADENFLGPLAALVGTWSGSGGLSITGVPARKSKPGDVGGFELLVRPYKEVFTFEAIPGAVKQRGGSIEQFSGVVTYKKEVWATDDDPGLIHVEDGMLFHLDNVQKYSDGTPGGKPDSGNKPPFAIARSATVPHGNSAMLFGNYKIADGAPSIPDIDARPIPNAGIPSYDSPFFSPNNIKYNAANPNKNLQLAIADQKIAKTTHISLDSRNEGTVTNTPFIKSRADTTGFRCNFWIETMKGGGQQLQYSEIVDIFFHKTKGRDELINWPHVMINTLTKEA